MHSDYENHDQRIISRIDSLETRIAQLEAKHVQHKTVAHHMGCPAINGYEGMDSKCLCGADEANQHI